MSRSGRWALPALLSCAAFTLALAAVLLLWGLSLPAEDQAVLGRRLLSHGAVGLLVWAMAVLGIVVFWRRLDAQVLRGPARLQEQVRLVAASQVPLQLEAPAGAGRDLQGLVTAINELAAARDRLREDVAAQVAQVSAVVRQERNRLAALMAELTQSVVVCNLDGRILLYNNRARLQFKALSREPALAGGAEWVGIGRSIYAVLDRAMLAHGLENIRQRLARGASHPSTQFLTSTPSGQLLRVQMAPVRTAEGAETPAGEDPGQGPEMAGFVLMLDNVTSSFAQESQRDQLLLGLTEGSRSSLANVQAAIEMLAYEDLDAAMRERFLGVVREEVRSMSQRITDLVARSTEALKTRWPLEDMPGADLLVAAQRRIGQQTGGDVRLEAVAPELWVRVDSFGLLQALTYLASRLFEEFEVRYVQLRLGPAQQAEQVHLDLLWSGTTISTETVMSWELDPMHLGDERNPLTVRDVMDRHSGVIWFERDRIRGLAFFRLVLPVAQAQEAIEPAQVLGSDSRPEYFDFDLFKPSAQHHALDDRPLSSLTYTVFDTETTGLNPSEGDEIIQIGATRIVNGRLLRHEAFEQLIDPGRRIPAASIPIHGITQDMVDGRPRIAQVLPVFHAYAADTVLVAHNAAFDMKFLQLQEARTGLRFDQPVLDTLMLSAVIHPNQESHRLEAIAERMNITILGRHTALGDALVTAEVFLRMIPLLADMGIHTLGQAREAAQKTYYARLKY